MKNYLAIMMILATGLSFTSCKKDANSNNEFTNRSTSAADYSQSSLPVVTVSGDITTSTTWTSGNVYELSGVVTVKSGATLTIQAGTYIKSTVNTVGGPANGVLVIAKDGSINATGTSTNPIVFTSRSLLDGNATTVGKPGDFGGVIILGNAVVNVANKLIEGLPDQPQFHYGGSSDADNRGTFKYVRIEFAGFQLAPNIEVNGLTLGGVGSGTTIDHVQTSYGLDDGFEFFGGKVNPKYLVSLATDDDQFDFDNGYTGSIQYAIAVADAYSTHSASSGNSDSNGMESDNNSPTEDATFTLLPKTHPVLSNFSIVGTSAATLSPAITAPGFKYGIRERRGSEITLNNSLITGYPSGLVFDADASATPSTINNISVHGFTAAISVAAGAYTATGTNLTSTALAADKWGMSQPFYNSGAVNFLAASGTKGAITTTSGNWVSGWTKFTF